MKKEYGLLDDIKNSELIAIYEDKSKKVQIDYEKDGVIKTLLINSHFASEVIPELFPKVKIKDKYIHKPQINIYLQYYYLEYIV